MAGGLGFTITDDEAKKKESDYADMKKRVMDAMQRTFRPEFINRLDGVMVFQSLDMDSIKDIVDLELQAGAHAVGRARNRAST